jgi:acetyl esterase/lipase
VGAVFLAGAALAQERPRPPAPGAPTGSARKADELGDRTLKYLASLNDVEFVRDVEFGKGGERPLKLHILRPKMPPKEPMPVIVYIFPGGWEFGSKNDGIYHQSLFAKRGYFCITMDYRLSGEAKFPAQIEDCKCAIRFLRAKAKEYNIDPNRIGVWGSSAGGHLAALVGTSGNVKELEGKGGWPDYSSSVQAVCACAPPADFLKWDKGAFGAGEGLIGGPFAKNKEKAVLASPVTHVHKDVPPFLIIHGEKDGVVPVSQAELLHEALKKVGADVTLHIEKGAPHTVIAAGPHIQKMIHNFFDKHLKLGKAKGTPPR